MSARLGVNIDHVATLRQARGEAYPSLVKAAEVVFAAGADQLTIHLREDRRHIQDHDPFELIEVCREFKRPLNFEMGSAKEIIEIAKRLAPDWICLVPEKREEKTTEGGLNLTDKSQADKILNAILEIKESSPNTKVSLFLEANPAILEVACKMPIEAVEIHTGAYAIDYNQKLSTNQYLESFKLAYEQLKSSNIACHAGHGLTIPTTKTLVKENYFEEYNIGHAIICESVFKGLDNVVREYKNCLL